MKSECLGSWSILSFCYTEHPSFHIIVFVNSTIYKSLLYSNFVGEYSYVASGFWCTLLFEHIIICNNALMSHSNSIWEIIYRIKEQCNGIVCLDLSFWAIHSSTQIIMIISWGKCQSSPFYIILDIAFKDLPILFLYLNRHTRVCLQELGDIYKRIIKQ